MITVAGSLNIDLVTEAERFPLPGETILGTGFSTVFGGKGANQAVAAARLGGQVKMVGKVGNDLYGESYLEYLTNETVDVSNVKPVTHLPTGTASIVVAEQDNQIIVVAGANGDVDGDFIKEEMTGSQKGVLLVQLEIPDEAVEEAMKAAKANGSTVILNPAPFKPLPAEWWELADYITPNEHEAASLKKESNFHEAYREKLIVTRGSEGASFFEKGEEVLVPAPKVTPVDTTGAGDTFNGALAAFLDQGLALRQAVEKAVKAASMSITALGAQSAMPTLQQLEGGGDHAEK
ncbi:ribokinase [Jeotgalibacillus haloalkalitolerans]|uniref:Ribokinase n=1 Tax=Jeotgalibacillus haloalkalitolerans TaxID=3104292 RepID=A0ABU5KHV3_9BACL|nr:ribokinase [Jeotgalibacillus sp. HH7-29]MDZ5710755.1 ribokinase [Jeotgalibacillus sp. HH7-29]